MKILQMKSEPTLQPDKLILLQRHRPLQWRLRMVLCLFRLLLLQLLLNQAPLACPFLSHLLQLQLQKQQQQPLLHQCGLCAPKRRGLVNVVSLW